MGAEEPVARTRHIVDVLLEERAPRLMNSPFWPLLKGPLFALLDYHGARAVADAISPLNGRAALSFARDMLHLQVRSRGIERVPAGGRCLIVANHPTGIADGVAVSEALQSIRPDHCFFANADALRVCSGLKEVLIPVEWMEEKRTVEKTKLTLRLAREALAAEQAVVIFPAGAPARLIGARIQEPPWERAAVTLARGADAPVIPVHVSGPPSYSYHLFHLVSRELRNLTLFREFLNKAGRRFDLTFGPPIAPVDMQGDAKAVIRRLRAYVARRLARAPDQPFA
jgi:putative hemolysin